MGLRRGWSPGNREKIRAEGCCDEPSETAVTNSIVLRLDHLFPLISPAIFHPVFRFFVSPILAFEISPPVFQPLRPTGRNSVCAKPLQIKSRRERSGGWVASIFRSLHLRFSGTIPGRAWGKPVRRPITDRPLALRAMHRYAGRIKEIGDTRPRQHDP